MKVEYIGNTEFEQEYLPKYESVISTSGLYLNEQNALTNLKEVGDLLENEKLNKATESKENNLRILNSIKIPEDEQQSEQTKDLKVLIEKIESDLYSQIYFPVIGQIKNLPLSDDGIKEKERIENQYGNTYCKKCKTELSCSY